MQKFIVTIEETIDQGFEIMAETSDEAKDIAINNYKSGIFVLDNPSVCHKQVSVIEYKNDELDEWEEF